MGRIRYMKPDFFKDEDLGCLPFETRLLFAGMWTIADKEGRLEDRPIRIKAEIFPYDDVDVEKNLVLLANTKTYGNGAFIDRYVVDGKQFIQISNWEKHQKPHHTEKGSIIPPVFIDNDCNIKGDGKGNGKGKCSQSGSVVNPPLFNREITVKSPSFVKPTIEDLNKYKEEIGFTAFDPHSFLDFYESKGWLVGKNKMKCWKAAVRTWQRRSAGEVQKKSRLLALPGKTCGKCGMPAVYKSAGEFDHYYCEEHMPAKVREKYCG